MNRNVVLVFVNVFVLIVIASVAAKAQWTVTKSATLSPINGGNPYHTPPGTKISVTLSSTHTAKVVNTSGVNQNGNVTISMRLYEELTMQTHDVNLANTGGIVPFAAGDQFYINGFFPSGNNGDQLTSNLTGAKDYMASSYTAHAFTHILVNSVGFNSDDTAGFQVISP